MKKLMLLAMGIVTGVTAHAYDYPYLTFELADGTVQSIAVDDLTMNAAAGSLVAANSSQTLTLTLTQLQKMYFATSATGISTVATQAQGGPVEVYTLQGIHMGTFASAASAKSALRSGVYVMKNNNGTQKIAIR